MGEAPRLKPCELTAGEWTVLGYLAARSSDGGERTPQVIAGTKLATADDMLRVLRGHGLVTSRHIPGSGHVLTWSLTNRGVDAGWEREQLLRAAQEVTVNLRARLLPGAAAYVERYARWVCGLSEHQPGDGSMRVSIARWMRQVVHEDLDRATGGRYNLRSNPDIRP